VGYAQAPNVPEERAVYTLYYSPGTASLVVHLALLEIGAPHRLERVDFSKDAQRSAEYLRVNPRGQVPALLVDGKAYVESAALLMLLAERHPEAKLAPPVGSPQRGDWYQWIAFFASSLAPIYRQWFYPQDLGSPEHPPFVRDALRQRIEEAWSLVDAHLAARGPYMLGAEFSGVDLQALMYMRWSRNMPKPATEWPALKAFADRMRQRPSWKRLYEIEGLTDWAS
jgi:glutathione S-transferase